MSAIWGIFFMIDSVYRMEDTKLYFLYGFGYTSSELAR